MPPPDIIRYAILSILTGVLIWAAVNDVIARRIPNASVLAILGLFVFWAGFQGGANLGSQLAAAGIGFVVGYALYACRIMGAGDAKLFAATALFVGLDHLSAFALATVLTGGAMALVSVASRPTRALVMLNLRGKGDFGRGIPYGVAIGVGGIVVLWGYLTGLLPMNVAAFV
jgi:prepilin peptidase CpaA